MPLPARYMPNLRWYGSCSPMPRPIRAGTRPHGPVVRVVRRRSEAGGREHLIYMSAQPLEIDPFAALGDPYRRAIVESLAGGDRSVQEIADALPISRPAVSRHLRLLKEAGLVVDRPEGTRRLYRLAAQEGDCGA